MGRKRWQRVTSELPSKRNWVQLPIRRPRVSKHRQNKYTAPVDIIQKIQISYHLKTIFIYIQLQFLKPSSAIFLIERIQPPKLKKTKRTNYKDGRESNLIKMLFLKCLIPHLHEFVEMAIPLPRYWWCFSIRLNHTHYPIIHSTHTGTITHTEKRGVNYSNPWKILDIVNPFQGKSVGRETRHCGKEWAREIGKREQFPTQQSTNFSSVDVKRTTHN